MISMLLALGGGVLGGVIMIVLIDKLGHKRAGLLWLVITILALAYLYA